MARIYFAWACWTGLAALACAGEVSIVQQSERAIVRIDGDVFAVYRFGADQPKPFFLPVVGSGGFEGFPQHPDGNQDSSDNLVLVVSETPVLTGSDNEVASAAAGEVLHAGPVEGRRVFLPAKAAWIDRGDVAPLRAIVTRLEEETHHHQGTARFDHPHHRGIWFAVDEVNGKGFWNEDNRIVSQSVAMREPADGRCSLDVVNYWNDEQEQPLLKERSSIEATADRLLIFDVTLEAMTDVTMGDTKEGLLGIRLPESMREVSGKGPVRASDGSTGSQEIWGRTARWVNYQGPVGQGPVGQGPMGASVFSVTLMDHPENPWPSRYHVRNYGLLAISPFGEQAYTALSPQPRPARTVKLAKGESLRFRYGFWVAGAESDEAIHRQYETFVNAAPNE